MKKFCIACAFLIFISTNSFAAVFFIITGTPTGCSNDNTGSLTITVTSGVAPFQYSLDGVNYTSSNTFTGIGAGVYQVTVKDATGDTGTQNIVLTASMQATYSSLSETVCGNLLPYQFNGTDIYSAGTYYDTLMNVAGCDSIITLNLAIIAVSNSTTNISICPTQLPYNWNGQQYNMAGSYNMTFTASSGCDSVATLNLFITTIDEWIGTTNTAWENPSNWSCGAVPGPASDVIINSGTVVVNVSTTINSLVVAPGASVTVSAGANLTVLH